MGRVHGGSVGGSVPGAFCRKHSLRALRANTHIVTELSQSHPSDCVPPLLDNSEVVNATVTALEAFTDRLFGYATSQE